MERYNDILDANQQAEEAYQPHYASFWERLGAYVIDSIVLSIPSYLVMFLVMFGMGMNDPQALESGEGVGAMMAMYAVLFVLVIAYFPLMESSKHRATLGKMALKIQVNNAQGGRISTGQAFGRFFGKIISGLIIYIGYLMVLWDDENQALHDKMAKTWVVRR